MNAAFLVLAVFSFLHGVRDVMQYYGKRNFFTSFLHFWGNRNLEIPSAIVSFALCGILFWVDIA